jgi:hypothetical protein
MGCALGVLLEEGIVEGFQVGICGWRCERLFDDLRDLRGKWFGEFGDYRKLARRWFSRMRTGLTGLAEAHALLVKRGVFGVDFSSRL